MSVGQQTNLTAMELITLLAKADLQAKIQFSVNDIGYTSFSINETSGVLDIQLVHLVAEAEADDPYDAYDHIGLSQLMSIIKEFDIVYVRTLDPSSLLRMRCIEAIKEHFNSYGTDILIERFGKATYHNTYIDGPL